MYESSPIKFFGPWRVTNYYKGSPTVSSRYSNFLNATNYRSGSDNPSWRRQIAEGVSATTAFNGDEFEAIRWGDGHARVERVPTPAAALYKIEVDGILGAVYTFPTGANATLALNKAKEHLVRKARDFTNPLQMGVVMGELMKTVHMVRHPLLGLRKGLDTYYARAKKLKQKLYVSRKERQKALAGAYLESVFGWQPLVADIEGGLDALDLYFAKRPFEIKRFTGYGKDLVTTRSQTSWNGNSNLIVKSDWRLSDQYSSRVRAGVRIRSEGSEAPINKLRGLLGLNLRAFAPSLYELLPYSFLIDYFSNLGSIIDACSYLHGNVAWICHNSRRVQNRILLGQTCEASDSFLNPTVEAISPTKFHIRKKTVSRAPMGSLVPDFRVQLPGLMTKQALNILALSLQRFA